MGFQATHFETSKVNPARLAKRSVISLSCSLVIHSTPDNSKLQGKFRRSIETGRLYNKASRTPRVIFVE